VGRLTWEKDFETYLRALARVREHRPVRGIILGEGPQRPALQELSRTLGLDEDVRMPGFVTNPTAFMAHAAVFVMSSRTEGLPTVLIEALAAGAPVVSTDCPSGPREVLRDGEFGTLVPVGDAEALASAILARLGEPRRRVPAEAWKPYTLETAVDGYLRLLELTPHA
jgi:glycosyltransferase involved in cell wall biosynthesis